MSFTEYYTTGSRFPLENATPLSGSPVPAPVPTTESWFSPSGISEVFSEALRMLFRVFLGGILTGFSNLVGGVFRSIGSAFRSVGDGFDHGAQFAESSPQNAAALSVFSLAFLFSSYWLYRAFQMTNFIRNPLSFFTGHPSTGAGTNVNVNVNVELPKSEPPKQEKLKTRKGHRRAQSSGGASPNIVLNFYSQSPGGTSYSPFHSPGGAPSIVEVPSHQPLELTNQSSPKVELVGTPRELAGTPGELSGTPVRTLIFTPSDRPGTPNGLLSPASNCTVTSPDQLTPQSAQSEGHSPSPGGNRVGKREMQDIEATRKALNLG
jgi:hypothetical protein